MQFPLLTNAENHRVPNLVNKADGSILRLVFFSQKRTKRLVRHMRMVQLCGLFFFQPIRKTNGWCVMCWNIIMVKQPTVLSVGHHHVALSHIQVVMLVYYLSLWWEKPKARFWSVIVTFALQICCLVLLGKEKQMVSASCKKSASFYYNFHF